MLFNKGEQKFECIAFASLNREHHERFLLPFLCVRLTGEHKASVHDIRHGVMLFGTSTLKMHRVIEMKLWV